MKPRGTEDRSLWLLVICSAVGFAAGGMAGCETKWIVNPTPTHVTGQPEAQPVDISDMKKVAIFPFADYSQIQPDEHSPNVGLNNRLMEEIADYFVARGVEVAVEEDVIGLLKAEKVLVLYKNVPERANIEWELKTKHHMPALQEDLANMISDDSVWGTGEGKAGGNPRPQGALTGMSKSLLKKIGDELGVDKVVRGRILDYGITSTKSNNPGNGILAMALGGIAEGMGAFVRRDGYEEGLPPSTYKAESTRGGQYDLKMDIPARERLSHVQIRVYLQDVNSGRILWSNRAYVQYSPGSNFNFAGSRTQQMLDYAMKEAVKGLMEDLFKNILPHESDLDTFQG